MAARDGGVRGGLLDRVGISTASPSRGVRKQGATLCLRTQVKCDKLVCHNELRSNSNISQEVFIRSHTQSQPAPLKPVISKRHRQRPTAGSRLGVDTRVGLSPRMPVGLVGLPEGACRGGPRANAAGPGFRGAVRGGDPGRAWVGGAWRGLAELVQTIMASSGSR
jgi:hypothetical protein